MPAAPSHSPRHAPDTETLLAYTVAALKRSRGRHDFRIPAIVIESWSGTGACTLSTNDLARRFGSTRRTMCLALDRLEAAGVIRQIGRTPEGRRIVEPCLEIASDHMGAVNG